MSAVRDSAVRTGLGLLNEVGLDGLTLRAIAAVIGIQAPTLYWHFKNKQDLIDEMATQVLADWAPGLMAELSALSSWQERTVAFGRSLRAALLCYRDGARMVAGSYLTDTKFHEVMEAMLESVSATGVKAEDAAICLHTVYTFVIGFTLEEQAVLSPKGERNPRYELSAREARLDAKRFPLSRGAGSAFFDNYDARFGKGLRIIIAGFSAGQAASGGVSDEAETAAPQENASKHEARARSRPNRSRSRSRSH